jgi:hypothetical protein
MLRGVSYFSVIFFLFLSVSSYAYKNLEEALEEPIFNLDSFVTKLNNLSHDNSLESTLAELKKSEPSFFKNYVLMYKSRSLQTSSFMYPRVLLSSPDSKTVISFNGNSDDHGFEKLEVMRFEPKTTSFTFNEIGFEDGKLKLSKDNPKKCMNCHQNSSREVNDPRPNWEPYSTWPGAYSSLAVGGHELFNPESPKHDPILSRDAKLENKMYQRFLNRVAPYHPRYSLLKPMEKNSLDRFFPAIGFPRGATNKFTTIFTDNLMNLNIHRIVRLIGQTPIINDYRKVVLAITKCSNLVLPDEIMDWHKKHHPTNLVEHIKYDQLDEALEFIFHPYGISTRDWSMDFGTGGKFAFKHRFGGPNNFVTNFNKALLESFEEYGIPKSCKDLKKEVQELKFESTKHLRAQKDLDFLDGGNHSTNLISRCTSCHTSSFFGAPYIPFDDETKLASALNKRGYSRGTLKKEIFYRIGTHAQFFERMPADGYIPSQVEIDDFKAYLNSL